jgi:transcriptional regulator with XRE-family HTH domain
VHLEVHYAALVDVGTLALARAIGLRIKQERQVRRWTLDQLAAAAGVSRRMLVNVEHGEVNPSVGTLLRLSDALGVGLPALVRSPEPARVRVVRAGDGAALWTSELGGRGVLVAGTDPPDVVELWDWRLAVGDRCVSEPHTAGTRELAQVLEGSVEITVADQRVTLELGDAISFHGDVAHSYANTGPAPARFSLAVFEPGVGDTHHRDGRDG